MENSSIKEKIAKVLEIARRGGTEAEADTAMKMALELLAKHNIAMSDITTDSPEDEDIISSATDGDNGQPWQRSIWYAIAKLYFTQYYSSFYTMAGKKRISYVVVGRESNVAAVKEISEHLVSICKSLSSGQDAQYRNSFRTGFADRIRQRANEQRAAAISENQKQIAQAPAGSSLPMLTNIYALRISEATDFLRAKGIRLKTVTSSWGSRSGDGYGAGQAAANSASLTRSSVKRIGM